MGNNHDKYFGSDKRKIIVLGFQKAGKTTFVRYVSKEKVDLNTEKTKNLNIEDVKIKDLNVTFFVRIFLEKDLAGGERQRVFWKQQYQGTQGIIFVIDVTAPRQQKEKSLEELDKVLKQFDTSIPVVIGLSKIDQSQVIQWSRYKMELTKAIEDKYKDRKLLQIHQIDYKNKQGIKNFLTWLLGHTKPI